MWDNWRRRNRSRGTSFEYVVWKTISSLFWSLAIYLVREFLRKYSRANTCSLHSNEMTRGWEERRSFLVRPAVWSPNETFSRKTSLVWVVDREYSRFRPFRSISGDADSPFAFFVAQTPSEAPMRREKSRAWEEEKDFLKRARARARRHNNPRHGRALGRERGTELRSLNCSGSG